MFNGSFLTPRFQARHHPKAVALVLLILLVSSCTDGTKESRGLVIASHDTAVQPPGLESAEEAFGTSIEALTTDDIFESFQAFSDGDASVALLAGPAIDIAMQSSPGAHALLPLNLSDSNDHVLLIASRGTLIEPSGENQDINADVFPQGLETRQFAFGPTDSIGTDIATFGVRQLKGTTVNRFFTQRSTQLDSAQAVISAVKMVTWKSVPSWSPTTFQHSLKNLVSLLVLVLSGEDPQPCGGLSRAIWMTDLVQAPP